MNNAMDEDSQESDFIGFSCTSEELSKSRQKIKFFQEDDRCKGIFMEEDTTSQLVSSIQCHQQSSFDYKPFFQQDDRCKGIFMEEDTTSQLVSSIQRHQQSSFDYKPVVFTQNNEALMNEDSSNEELLGFLKPSEDLYGFYLKKNVTVHKKKVIRQKRKMEIFFLHSYDRNDNVTNSSRCDHLNSEEGASSSAVVNGHKNNSSSASDSDNEADVKTENYISDYERIRLNNIKERREYMIQMGLMKEDSEKVKKTKVNKTSRVKTPLYPSRRSARLSHSLDDTDFHFLSYDPVSDDADENKNIKKTSYIKRPNSYGAIKGVPVGEAWTTRLECNAAGIHRPTVAGIHPGPKGAYSVVLSGGYDDDVDDGDSFTYTGSGGRDLKGTKANPKNLRTAPQSKDQTLNLGNASLIYSCDHKKPIRVVRGYKLKSLYAPEEGYRYDGLYEIAKWWLSEGFSGYLTYKFLFKRCNNQEPAPWSS